MSKIEKQIRICLKDSGVNFTAMIKDMIIYGYALIDIGDKSHGCDEAEYRQIRADQD